METNASQAACPNCTSPIEDEGLYCPNCGQRSQNPKIPVWSVIKDFLYDQLHLDTRLYYALGKIWVPGKLTQVYFQGKRKAQSNPFRLFLIFTVVALTVFNLLYLRNINNPDLVNVFEIEDYFTDISQYRGAIREIDRLINNDTITTSMDRQALRDSLNKLLKLDLDTIEFPNIIGDALATENYIKIPASDFYDLNPKELSQKYMTDYSSLERYVMQQQIKVMRNSDNLIPFLIGNIIWILFTQVIGSALILKLLYIRRKRYFIEHIIFSLHYQAFAMLLIIIGLFVFNIFTPITAILAPVLLIYVFLAMKNYYNQGYGKTFLKYLIYLNATLMIFITFMSFGQMISMLFF